MEYFKKLRVIPRPETMETVKSKDIAWRTMRLLTSLTSFGLGPRRPVTGPTFDSDHTFIHISSNYHLPASIFCLCVLANVRHISYSCRAKDDVAHRLVCNLAFQVEGARLASSLGIAMVQGLSADYLALHLSRSLSPSFVASSLLP